MGQITKRKFKKRGACPVENSTWSFRKPDAIMKYIQKRGFADERKFNAGKTNRETV